LKAKTDLVGESIALSSVNIELDGNTAEGVLTYAADGRRTLQGTLAADNLDVTPYLSTIRLMAGNAPRLDRMPIRLDGFNNFDLDLRLSAARVTIGNASLAHRGRRQFARRTTGRHGGRIASLRCEFEQR